MLKQLPICALVATLASAGFAAAQSLPAPKGDAMPPAIEEPVRQQTSNMSGAMTGIVDWLSAEFGLPASDAHPRIELAPLSVLVAKRYRGLAPAPQQGAAGIGPSLHPHVARDLVAIYDDASRTIYLLDGWTGATHAEMSVLVHEMVHHLQNAAGLRYECPQAREKLAYAAQQKWLERFDRDFFAEFETDPITLMLRTVCGH